MEICRQREGCTSEDAVSSLEVAVEDPVGNSTKTLGIGMFCDSEPRPHSGCVSGLRDWILVISLPTRHLYSEADLHSLLLILQSKCGSGTLSNDKPSYLD